MSGLSPALAAQLQEVIDRWSANQAQFSDWLAGTVGGGPNNDGRYPLTNAQGVEITVASPASILDMVEGPAAQAQVAKLAAQSAASAAAASASNTDAAKVLAEAAKTAAVAARNLAQTAQSNAANHEANARHWAELAEGKGGEINVMVATVTDLAQQVAADAVSAEANAESAAVSAGLAATFEPNNFDLKSDTIAANRVTGTLSLSNIPVLPSQIQVASSGGLAALTSPQQAQIGQGSIVTTTDGGRWVYKGTGSKTVEASYIMLADVTPDWNQIVNVPTTFLPSTHSHTHTDVNGFTWANLGSKPLTFAPSAHGHAWSEITGVPASFAPTAHTHDWSEVTGKPTIFASNIANVSGLQGALDARLTTGNPAASGSMTVSGSVPSVRFVETDQTAPSGGWQFNVNSGHLYLRKNTASPVDFSTQNIVITINGTTDVVSFANTPAVSGGNQIWHAGNDGAGSGLDADLVRGVTFSNSNQSSPVSAPDSLDKNGVSYVTGISLFGQVDGALYSQAYSSAWQHQIFGDYRTGSMAIRGKNAGSWQTWRTVWDSGNDGVGSGLDADYVRGLIPNTAHSTNTLVQRDASGQFAVQGIDFNMQLGNNLDGAPYYGIGKSTLTSLSGGVNNAIQAMGYYGLRLRSATATIDLHTSGRIIAAMGGKDFRIDGPIAALGGIIDYSRDDSVLRPSRVLIPDGGTSVGNPTLTTGAIKIRLPAAMNNSNTMMTFTVVVFEYSTGMTKRFHLAGYNYNNGWINVTARQDGDAQSSSYMVRYGHDGVSNCMWIGETGTQWSYPQVHIMDVTLGYSGYSNAIASGWSVGFVTAFDTVTGSRSAAVSWTSNNDGAGSSLDADLLDGLQAASFLRSNASNPSVPITSTAASGLKFWDGNDAYSIRMSDVGNVTFGGRVSGDTASDYNMYFRMTGTARGFVFQNSTTNVAGIDGYGNGRFTGDVFAKGTRVPVTTYSQTAPSGGVDGDVHIIW